MASLWWEEEWKDVSPANASGYMQAVKQYLPQHGYTDISGDDTSVVAFKDDAEVTVWFLESGKTGKFPDGSPSLQMFQLVICAAGDEAGAQAIVNELWTFIKGIGFL
jgi:hypothetical protein